MFADLRKVKERLEKEGVVNNVEHNYYRNEIIVNQEHFIMDELKNESYHIRITTDFYKKFYQVITNFCKGDFLNNYNNQESYIRNVVNEMNEEIKNEIKSKQEFIRNTINTKAVGEFILKEILEEHLEKPRYGELYWVAKEIYELDNDIYKVYSEENICNIFEKFIVEEFLIRNHKNCFEFLTYFFTAKSTWYWNDDLKEGILKYILEETKKSNTSCYFNKYSNKFIPRQILKGTFNELNNLDEFSEIKLAESNDEEYIVITLKNKKSLEITVNEGYTYDIYYAKICDADSWYESAKEFNCIESLIEYLKGLSNLD